MAKKSEAKTVAWITFSGVIIAAIITGIFTFSKSSSSSQTSGGINNSTFSTSGDNSPVVAGNFNIENQTVQHIHKEELFVYVMKTQTVEKTVYLRNDDLGLTSRELTQISDYEKRSGKELPIPTNGIARIKTPQKMIDLSADLTTAYNAQKIDECVALASEGTNLFESVFAAYKNDGFSLVDYSFLSMAAECYQTLAEYWMFKKDYDTAIQLAERAQNSHPDTNFFTFATQAALYQLSGQDREFSIMLHDAKINFPEPLRYKIVNTLTRMGYLRQGSVKKNKAGKWEIDSAMKLEEYYNLTNDLHFPFVLRAVGDNCMSNPTTMKWVGLNQYEPVDLVKLDQSLLKSLEENDPSQEPAKSADVSQANP